MSKSDATYTEEWEDGTGTSRGTSVRDERGERVLVGGGGTSPAGWGRGEQRWGEGMIQETVASALDLEDLISTSGRRAREANTNQAGRSPGLRWEGTEEVGGPSLSTEGRKAGGRRGRARFTSTGVVGSGLCLRVRHESPDTLDRQAGRTQRDPVLIRNKQLCSTCQEKKMVRPTTVVIPDDLKLPFANLVDRRIHVNTIKEKELQKQWLLACHCSLLQSGLNARLTERCILIHQKPGLYPNVLVMTSQQRAFTIDCPSWAPGQLSSMGCCQMPSQLCRRHSSLPCPERGPWTSQ
ncbi:uncharacterized protein C1orf105 homolog [Camelus ferus]|uniref:Uncharacterized protein C1orf105 homolog n=1 Tax=Camelus ferus TaxID=419612 RepID=A0A8B8RTQ9_CAMFR|nr:uncharacterized protein C1orf105 homolog [Camelus ferus]